MDKRNKTSYTIVRIPSYIVFECPYCNMENEVAWDDIEGQSIDVIYDKWTGNIYPIECEYCEKTVEFDQCEVD